MVKVSYNPKTGEILGYYPEDVNYPIIPELYIEITEDQHLQCINNSGLCKVDLARKMLTIDTSPELTAEQIMQQKIIALDVEYQPQFAELAQALGMANLAENNDLITSLKADYATLKIEYDTKRGEISGS